jgi:hypothetical protein
MREQRSFRGQPRLQRSASDIGRLLQKPLKLPTDNDFPSPAAFRGLGQA